MVSDHEKMEAVLENAFVMVTDQKINNVQEVLPVLEQDVYKRQGYKFAWL